MERLHDAVEIQRDVLVDQDIPESGQHGQGWHQGREARIPAEVADRFRVVLESLATSGRELGGDTDHDLTDRLQRVRHVVAEREIARNASALVTRGRIRTR